MRKMEIIWKFMWAMFAIMIVLFGFALWQEHVEEERLKAKMDARTYLIQALVHKDDRDVANEIVMMRQVLSNVQLTLHDIDVTEKIISKTLISGYVSMIEHLKEESHKNPDLMGGTEAEKRIKLYREKILEERKKFPDA